MSTAQYNQLVHKLVEDTELLLTAILKMTSDVEDTQKNSDTSDEDTSDDACDDDVFKYNGENYHYHPPQLNERVQILWILAGGGTDWLVATITKTTTNRKKKIYTIRYDGGYMGEDYLNITEVPAKWRFLDK